jgi:predicted GNAT family N-acyltransferase
VTVVGVVVVPGSRLPAGARALRHEVFVGEQGLAGDLERDGRDDTAEHAVVTGPDGVVAATGRLLDSGPPAAVAVVGRVAVRADRRGQGLGLTVMAALERRAAERGLVAVELHAQLDAAGFYRRQGYVACGEPYVEAGIGHVTMRKEMLPGIRPVRDADGPALARLIGAVWAEYPGCVLDIDGEEPWLRAPATAYEHQGGEFWVIPEPDDPGSLLACAGLRPGSSPGVVELKSLYVAAAARRRGFGAALVWRVERAARAMGATRIELWSDTRFHDAHRLYERLGYTRTGPTRSLNDRSATTEHHFTHPLLLHS